MGLAERIIDDTYNLFNFSASIPVGIAIGRQRQQDLSQVKRHEDFLRSHHHPLGLGGPGAAAAQQRVRSESGASGSAPGSSAIGTPGPSHHPGGPPPPHHWPPQFWSSPPGHLPGSPYPGSPGAGMPYWLPGGVPPIGPIPMGYQLAKDPLTGQILLIPTDGALPGSSQPPAGPGGLWNPSHHFDPASLYGREAQSHYHQLYLQHQQQLQYLQATSRDLLRGPNSTFPPIPMAKRNTTEPETITVSDDDDADESSANAKTEDKKADQTIDKSQSHGTDVKDKVKPAVPENLSEVNSKLAEVNLLPEVKSSRVEALEPKKESNDLIASTSAASEIVANDSSLETRVKLEERRKSPSLVARPDEEVAVKIEPKDTMDVLASPINVANDKFCAEALLTLSESSTPNERVVNDNDGLNILCEGIDVLLAAQEVTTTTTTTTSVRTSAFDLLFSATQEDSMRLGVYKKYLDQEVLDVDLLCAVTQDEYEEHLNYVNPMVLLRQQYNLHQYKSTESESVAREFIEQRMKRCSKDTSQSGESEDDYWGIKSLAKIVKQIKNTEVMSQLEVDLRAQIVQLQTLFRERQKELARLKSSPKKRQNKDKSSKRGPGRPKKRKLQSVRTKMGRPRKKPAVVNVTAPSDDRVKPEVVEEEVEIEEEEEEEDLSPPVLEPCGAPPTKLPVLETSDSGNSSPSRGKLLKPPKLTASLSPPYTAANNSNPLPSTSYNRVTNLSTISARFMKGKANPFANLMKLATAGGPEQQSGKPGMVKSKLEDVTEEDEEEENAEESESEASEASIQQSPGRPASTSPMPAQSINKRPLYSLGKRESPAPPTGNLESTIEDNSGACASKKRKSEKPKKQNGGTETIVPKKPRNLFMMNCLSLQQGLKSGMRSAEDEYDFNEDNEASLNPSNLGSVSRPGKMFTEYRDPQQQPPSKSRNDSGPWSKSIQKVSGFFFNLNKY